MVLPTSMSKRAWCEAVAVLLTAALHPLAKHLLRAQGPFIVAAVVAWSVYVVMRARTDKRAVCTWGLSTDGLGPAARAAGILGLAGAAAMAAVASGRGSLRFHPDMLPLMVLYPVWGVVQQILVQGMVVGNVVSSYPGLARSGTVVVVAGLLFGAVHLPDPALTAATAVMGVLFATAFIRHRNVWPLGLVHGELGVLFYFWILERNPWPELLASAGLA